jgi:hypothetical protein
MSKSTFRGNGKEADAELRRICQEVDNGRASAGTDTLESLLKRWLQHCEQVGHAPSTLHEHKRMVDKIMFRRSARSSSVSSAPKIWTGCTAS